MAKTNQRKSKRFEYKGTTYETKRKGTKVQVRTYGTAKGQHHIVGVLDLEDGSWHNDELSAAVKQEVAKLYSLTPLKASGPA